ncbi:hypothetical protein N9A04_01025, partial [Rickettsiales bacterium]|nr:hypothetical protein [Rickettsiales bacterium]
FAITRKALLTTNFMDGNFAFSSVFSNQQTIKICFTLKENPSEGMVTMWFKKDPSFTLHRIEVVNGNNSNEKVDIRFKETQINSQIPKSVFEL